jgi:hypothetical protein
MIDTLDPAYYEEASAITDNLLQAFALAHDVEIEVSDELYYRIVATIQLLDEYEIDWNQDLYNQLANSVIPPIYRHIPYYLHVLIGQLKKTLQRT